VGDVTESLQYVFAVKHAEGNFRVGVTYQNIRNPNFSFYGNSPNSCTTGSNFASLAIQGFDSANALQNIGAGFSVDVGNATISAADTRTSFDYLGAVKVTNLTKEQAAHTGCAVFNAYDLNVLYKWTPALALGVGAA